MKLIILCLCLAVANCLDTTNYEWEWSQYKNTFNKHYSGETDIQRFAIFKENLKKINDHNDRFLNGDESYLMRTNIFTDMTPKEMKSHMGFKFVPEMAKRFNRTGSAHWHMVKGAKLPASVDWRTKGVVTPVKDQASCGSCWAFSTTGALEGQHALATGKLVSLSEQNLVDCTQQQGNFGCEGGWPFDAYEYIIRFSQGIDTEASYPYVGIDETCKYNPDTVGATETAFAILPPDNELALQDAVANIGPISVCIDADFNFQSYSGGVFDDAQCSSSFDDIDHCVLAVGYGHDTASGKDYWLVKNSWGSSWGENGYIKMVRNKMNQCAISTLASYPDVKTTF